MIHNIRSLTELSGFYIVFDGSTMLEGLGTRGASHLLEHLMTKSFDHLQDELQSSGISWNAYTSDHEVVFWFIGLENELAKFRRPILENLGRFEITEQQFQTEKAIVLQEYKDHFTDQYWTHYHNIMRSRFGHFSPIGQKQDLEEMTLDKMRSFFEAWYQVPSKIINVSNRYQHYTGRKLAVITVKDQPLVHNEHWDGFPWIEKSSQHEGTSSVRLFTMPITTDIPVLKFACSVLSNGLNSPLTQLVREKHGLVYGFWAQTFRYNTQGLVMMAGTTADQNVSKLVGLVNELLSDPEKAITTERVEVVRKEYQIEREVEAMERYRNVHRWLTPEEYQVEKILETVTREDVISVVKKYMNPDALTCSVDKIDFGRCLFPTVWKNWHVKLSHIQIFVE